MTKENSLRLHRFFGILIGISILIAGICLIWGCLTIYFSGDGVYSRQAVADTFGVIAIPVYICAALSALGFVLQISFPVCEKAQKPIPNNKHILERLSAKRNIDQCDKPLAEQIAKERKSRRIRSLILAVLLCVSGVVFAVYSLDSEHWRHAAPEEITESVLQALSVLFPCIAIPFLYAVYTVYSNDRSAKREIEALKRIPPMQKSENCENKQDGASDRLSKVRALLILASLVIIVCGLIFGGAADVFTKASNICTECIGLG